MPGGHQCLASACLTTSGRPTPLLQPCLCPSHPIISETNHHNQTTEKTGFLGESTFFRVEIRDILSSGKEERFVPMAGQGVVLSPCSPSFNCRRSSWSAMPQHSTKLDGRPVLLLLLPLLVLPYRASQPWVRGSRFETWTNRLIWWLA